MPSLRDGVFALIQRGIVDPTRDSTVTISTRATVTRKKNYVKGLTVSAWQLALIIIGSIIIFLGFTILIVWILRSRRTSRVDTWFSEADEERPKPKDDDGATLCESKHGMGMIGDPDSANRGRAAEVRSLERETIQDSKSLEEGKGGAHEGIEHVRRHG